jgi:hypothetical protein
LSPYINSLDIKDFTWKNDGEAMLMNVPLGKGLVPFPSYLEELKRRGVSADFSIHYEYPLGGAENGSGDLSITKEQFKELVGTDLRYFTSLYSHQ